MSILLEQKDDIYEELKERVLQELHKNLRSLQRSYTEKFMRLRLARNNAKTQRVLRDLELIPDIFREKSLPYTEIARRIAKGIAYIVNFPARCTLLKEDWANAVAEIADPTLEEPSHVMVYVTTGLLKLCSGKEFVAVLLHECGHLLFYSKKLAWRYDLTKLLSNIAGLIATLVTQYIRYKRSKKDPSIAFMVAGTVVYTFILGFPIFAMLCAPIRRAEERIADAVAAQYGYGEYLVRALKKLAYNKHSKVLSTSKWLHLLKKILIHVIGREYDTDEQRICKIYAYTLSTLDKRSPEYLRIKAQMRADHCERYLP